MWSGKTLLFPLGYTKKLILPLTMPMLLLILLFSIINIAFLINTRENQFRLGHFFFILSRAKVINTFLGMPQQYLKILCKPSPLKGVKYMPLGRRISEPRTQTQNPIFHAPRWRETRLSRKGSLKSNASSEGIA